MDNNIVLKIKDSVDLFLTDDLLLTVYYMNTRVRKTFKVNRLTISLLEAIDGKSNLYELSAIINLQPSDIKILIKALYIIELLLLYIIKIIMRLVLDILDN